jgi:hypothetical protein
MMFIVRSGGEKPVAPSVQIKAVRKTPRFVSGGAGKTDYFCVGDGEHILALRAEGWEVVDLRDGWYDDDNGGGIGISAHGKYWEIRDTPFSIKEAVGPVGDSVGAGKGGDDLVNVRRAIFGV